ncbi:2773_t:CDS:2, partial [Paraglomus brasilianum]
MSLQLRQKLTLLTLRGLRYCAYLYYEKKLAYCGMRTSLSTIDDISENNDPISLQELKDWEKSFSKIVNTFEEGYADSGSSNIFIKYRINKLKRLDKRLKEFLIQKRLEEIRLCKIPPKVFDLEGIRDVESALKYLRERNNGKSSSSKTKNKGKGKQIEDNETDDIIQSDKNLSAIQLREE